MIKRKNTHIFTTLILLGLTLLFSLFMPQHADAKKNKKYENYFLTIKQSDITMYTNHVYQHQHASYIHSGEQLSTEADSDTAFETIGNDLVWTVDNPGVVQFVTGRDYDENNNVSYRFSDRYDSDINYNITWAPELYGIAEGTTTITVTSKLLDTKLTCKVSVYNAKLTCTDFSFYTGNSYTFKLEGNATATTYTSSNENVASIDATSGVMKAKKAGKTTITCIGSNGATYSYKVKIDKAGLNYTKLTTYYYTGFRKGCYSHFPLVAKGIQVKKWKSSNKKVCKVINTDGIGLLQMRGTGKCTITCVAKNGKKYTCKLTVVGGKSWGGLSGGYSPTVSALKKHGYYNDINSIMDYGNVIVTIEEYDHEINLKNGNKRFKRMEAPEKAEKILAIRYPDKNVASVNGLGDHLCFTNNKGNKIGRIWVSCHYVNR